MRIVLLSLVIFLGGCLATQPSHNPLKQEKEKKQKEAAAAAPAVLEKPKAAKPKDLPLGLTKVDLMQEMFLMQKDLNFQILKMAEELTPSELEEFNEFLSPFGRELKAKICTNPNHDHSKPGHKSRAF